MKTIICTALLAAVCCIVIPINGQTARKNADAHQKHGDNAQPPKVDTVNVNTVNVTKFNVPQQPEPARRADNDSKEPPSYFHRLIAPENLPNLILSVVGIAGIIVAVRTLAAMNGQLEEMKTGGGIMTGQLEAMQEQLRAMREANQINRESMQAVQRAYIAFPMLDLQTLAEADNTGTVINYK